MSKYTTALSYVINEAPNNAQVDNNSEYRFSIQMFIWFCVHLQSLSSAQEWLNYPASSFYY